MRFCPLLLFFLPACLPLVQPDPITIPIPIDNHIDAQAQACLWTAHKCMDVSYAVDDMELSQDDLGLMIDNDLSCWEEWRASGCALIVEEVPSGDQKIEIPESKIRKIVIPEVLKPMKINRNPYDKKRRN